MNRYEIYSTMDTLGEYEGETELEAFFALMFDAGIRNRDKILEDWKNTNLKFRKIDLDNEG